jgi:hypothetical protein
MKLKKYFISLAVLIVFLPITVLAYEQRYAGSSSGYNISNPETAVGYYAKLPGKTARYVLYFEEPGGLHAELRIPDIPSADKNAMMQIYYKDQNGESNSLDLAYSEEEWEYYKDDFSGNGYYLGPKVNLEVASGTHSIIISSPPDNEKPYVLIIGDREDGSWKSEYRSFKELWKIKNSIYSELPLTAYKNVYGIVLAVPVMIVLGLLIYGAIKTYLNFKQTDEVLSGEMQSEKTDENT